MAPDAGTTGTPVSQALVEQPSRFTFLQAIWLLQRSLPQSVPLGHQGPPDDEPVRLRSSASLAFPPGDIESVEDRGDQRPRYQLTATFLGLYGAHSPLPNHYAEEILFKIEEDDPVRAFFDLFNHRLLSLFVRGLLRYRGHLLFGSGAGDSFSWRLFALAGLESEAVREALGIPEQRALRFVGHWCSHPKSAASVEAILRTYFDGVPIAVQQCVPRWVYLEEDQQCSIGRHSCRLGVDTTVGERVRDRMGKFRVVVGPVDFETYVSFLPNGENMRALRRLARLASDGWIDFDVDVILRRDDTPSLRVSLNAQGELGRTAGFFAEPIEDVSIRFDAPVGVG